MGKGRERRQERQRKGGKEGGEEGREKGREGGRKGGRKDRRTDWRLYCSKCLKSGLLSQRTKQGNICCFQLNGMRLPSILMFEGNVVNKCHVWPVHVSHLAGSQPKICCYGAGLNQMFCQGASRLKLLLHKCFVCSKNDNIASPNSLYDITGFYHTVKCENIQEDIDCTHTVIKTPSLVFRLVL